MAYKLKDEDYVRKSFYLNSGDSEELELLAKVYTEGNMSELVRTLSLFGGDILKAMGSKKRVQTVIDGYSPVLKKMLNNAKDWQSKNMDQSNFIYNNLDVDHALNLRKTSIRLIKLRELGFLITIILVLMFITYLARSNDTYFYFMAGITSAWSILLSFKFLMQEKQIPKEK